MIWRAIFSRPSVEVVLFTRAGCHLCDVALRVLKSRRRRYNLKIDCVDITREQSLLDQYNETIPVVRIQGKDRFFGHVDRVLLDRLLNSLSQK